LKTAYNQAREVKHMVLKIKEDDLPILEFMKKNGLSYKLKKEKMDFFL